MPVVNYGVEDGTGAPVGREASGKFETITITIDTAAVLVGTTAGTLPEGCLLCPDTGTANGQYIVADATRFGTEQDAGECVILDADVHGLLDGDMEHSAIIRGIWSGNYYNNGGAIAAADKALFDQRLIIRWDGTP